MTARRDALERLDAIVSLAEEVRAAARAAQDAVSKIISEPPQPERNQQ